MSKLIRLVPWSSWWSPGWMVLVASCLFPLAGCGDRTRRLSEGETQKYKRELVLSRRGAFSMKEAEIFFGHPARTRPEIDVAFERLRVRYQTEQAAERARLAAERRAERAAQQGATELEEGAAGDSPPEGESPEATLPGEGEGPRK